MIPSIGRIVIYRLSENDAQQVNVQAGQGGRVLNRVKGGEEFPLIITKVWSDTPSEDTSINGQLLLDGNFIHWLTSRQQGFAVGRWHDPRERQA